MEQILGSVGLLGANFPSDVCWVQTRLNIHRPSVSDARELKVDGIAGPGTINAIRKFQEIVLKSHAPDARVDPAGPTFRALTKASDQSLIPLASAPKIINFSGALRFPLAKRPVLDYHPNGAHHRWFGAWRNNKTRKHAGCDLIAPVGTEILVIGDGKVVGHSPSFYKGTHALEVAHECGLLARYCELKSLAPGVKIGSTVKRGHVIGYVGQLPSTSSMLHFELYANTQKGRLTVRDPTSLSIYEDKLFQRRSDLLDPTSYLDEATLL